MLLKSIPTIKLCTEFIFCIEDHLGCEFMSSIKVCLESKVLCNKQISCLKYPLEVSLKKQRVSLRKKKKRIISLYEMAHVVKPSIHFNLDMNILYWINTTIVHAKICLV